MTAEQRAKIFKALSDPWRVAIVDALAERGPMHCTELSETLGISLALLSHHGEVLFDAGLVKKERAGQRVLCTVDVERIRQATGGWDAAPRELRRPARAVRRRRARPT